LDRPCAWQPHTVLNPDTGQPFTPVAAWEFVVACLEDERVSLTSKPQDIPPGSTAFEMIVPIGTGGDRLYIKLRLGSGIVLGRSFHYAVR